MDQTVGTFVSDLSPNDVRIRSDAPSILLSRHVRISSRVRNSAGSNRHAFWPTPYPELAWLFVSQMAGLINSGRPTPMKLEQNMRLYRIFCICGFRAMSSGTCFRITHSSRSIFRPNRAGRKGAGAFPSAQSAPVIVDEVQYAPGLFRHLKGSRRLPPHSKRAVPAYRVAVSGDNGPEEAPSGMS
jgi:hypothetical protein